MLPCRSYSTLQRSFKYFEGVENRRPGPSFESSFSLLPATSAGNREHMLLDMARHGVFTVQNLGSVPLYLAIFNFTPSWQVVNLISLAGGGDFLCCLP